MTGSAIRQRVGVLALSLVGLLTLSACGSDGDGSPPNSIPPTVTFSQTTDGTGTGTITCNGVACLTSYPSGTVLTIEATSATSVFGGWGGDCAAAGTSATCTLTLNAYTAVSATFNLPVLSVVVAGTGAITSNPAGINCGPTCTASFVNQSMKYLTFDWRW
jgi:hypothetical protein